MHHETALISTLAGAFVLAFALGFLAIRVRLPPLVGYLLAGVLIGPFTPGFVADTTLAPQLAEIGVILLMFGVGLHFSIPDLMAVRKIALPGALAQTLTATAVGGILAYSWGWGLGAAVVFGLSLSVASTVVLLRALEQRNALQSPEGRIAVGWLIVEDLATVLVLVLLPALAQVLGGSQASAVAASGVDIIIAIGATLLKVVLFVGLALLVGKRAVPWLLMQAIRTGSRELFTLAVLAVALGIAYGSAILFDVSFALGAFFAGVILSESDLSHQAAADSLPLQDAFAVLFFVSVGMLFDPSILIREPAAVLAVLAIVMVGKSVAAFLIVLAFRYSVRTALTISASLAQIGEFSFILAGLGVTLGLLPSEGRDLVLAGALLSIALNPLAFAGIRPIMAWLSGQPRLLARFEPAIPRSLTPIKSQHLQGHVVLVGHGRVGGVIGPELQQQNIRVVVVERDRKLLEGLRSRGVPVVYGDASASGVLAAAGIDTASLLLITAPDGYQARRILEVARAANASIDVAVRTHIHAEQEYFEREHVGHVVMAEREVALSMLGYALRSLGAGPEANPGPTPAGRAAGGTEAPEPGHLP
jgi:CPA2 family monovalent cation:H+ antiporter-2